MDALLAETIHTLEKRGFSVQPVQNPDNQHFGNWILIAKLYNLALRVTRDRSDIFLDVAREQSDLQEQDWFNWDVVARALGIDLVPGQDPLHSFLGNEWHVLSAFDNWQITEPLLAAVEKEKRRRFTEGRRVPLHA